MKKYLIFLFLLISCSAQPQVTPAPIFRIPNDTTVFGSPIMAGSILCDIGSGKTYRILTSISGASSISTLTAGNLQELASSTVNSFSQLSLDVLPEPPDWGSANIETNTANSTLTLVEGTGITFQTDPILHALKISSTAESGITYTLSAETASSGAYLKLLGSDGSKDSVLLSEGEGMTITRTDAGTISFEAEGVAAPAVVEDISFEFADITAGTAQSYTLDISAVYGYTINSVFLETDSGTLTGIAVKIGSTAVTSLSSVTADATVDETSASGANTVSTGDRIWIHTSTGYTGTPTVLRGKLKITRT